MPGVPRRVRALHPAPFLAIDHRQRVGGKPGWRHHGNMRRTRGETSGKRGMAAIPLVID